MSELTRTHAEKVNSTKDILERKLQEIADLELQHANDKAIIEALNERVREIERQLDEYEAGSVLRWQCYQRAVNKWQAATGIENTWPDGTDLIMWLMGQLTRRDAAFAALVECVRATDQFNESINSCLSCRANLAINQTLCNFHGGRQHWVTEQRCEALKLAEDVENDQPSTTTDGS